MGRYNHSLSLDATRVFLAGHTVAMVTYCFTKSITTYSPMIGQFFDTMIVASSDKNWLQ